MSLRPLVLTTSDAVSLEAEIATPEGSSTATAVLCHPHPQYGGTRGS
jgi:alpha/beta superfamily hydrolase